ncbi:MAG: (Fe-S)-binding protein [Desulfitobacterium hafniense]|nr:(Fe-S)-binding protein [Desulfitobacterium hafniense]
MNYAEEANRCRRCGMCHAVCPLYKAERREQFVARGKVRLTKISEEGRIELEDRAKTTLYNCLDCRACMEVCPAGVNVSRLVKGMRKKIYDKHGDNLLMNVALEHLTSYPKRMELARKFLKLYQTTGLSSLVQLVPSLKEKEKILPAIPKRSFRNELKARDVRPGKKGKVAYFISCTTDILYPQVGEAVLEVLEACGYEIYPMNDGTCCGVPQVGYGHVERAKEMALQNMRSVPDDIGYILNDCATCGSALKEYPELFEGTEHEELAQNFAKRVMDISEFLIKHTELPTGEKLGIQVTYHDPCHLNRAQNVKQEPRDIIAHSGSELIEMENSGQCCGGAGTFGITHFDLSQKLLKQKVGNIKATGAEAVVTGCPACRMQIAFGLKSYYKDIPVYHPVELIARSIREKGM